MIRNELARRLKMFREARGLTIFEVGDIVGKSGKTVSAWENGRGQPDADMLLRLCEVYGIASIDELCGVAPVPALTAEERELLAAFRSFNDEGREKVSAYVSDLAMTGIYKNDSVDRLASKEA